MNGVSRFSRNYRVISRKKLHSVCILTKGYHHAKEERIWIFKLCRSMFDFYTDLLLILFQKWLWNIPKQKENKNKYILNRYEDTEVVMWPIMWLLAWISTAYPRYINLLFFVKPKKTYLLLLLQISITVLATKKHRNSIKWDFIQIFEEEMA